MTTWRAVPLICGSFLNSTISISSKPSLLTTQAHTGCNVIAAFRRTTKPEHTSSIVREFNRKKLAEQKASSAAKNAQSKTKGHPRATVKQASVPETSQQVTR